MVEMLKDLIINEIDFRRPELCDISLRIHDNPELAFHEVKAATWLTQYLKENGFSVEQGICDLRTAFRAVYGQGRPTIAVLAEYDALPKIGHACGHNIIAGSAIAAGVASKLAIDQFGGSILVIGTPAEEISGGKAIMAQREAFKDIDVAMIVHPGGHNAVITNSLACQSLEVEFFGKAAHAAARPQAGINALEAMLQSFAAINSLRQHIKSSARIHGIITDGGEAANIVPAHSAGIFLVRAADETYMEKLKQKVINCFIGSATASGARLEYKWADIYYAPMYNNLALARIFKRNMRVFRPRVRLIDPAQSFGSTDMGNVSQLVPSIHPTVSITTKGGSVHSVQFAEAAASDTGMQGMIDAAKAIAMTVADILSNPDVLIEIQEDFQRK